MCASSPIISQILTDPKIQLGNDQYYVTVYDQPWQSAEASVGLVRCDDTLCRKV